MMEIKSGVYVFINNDWVMLLFSMYIFAHYTDVLTVHDCPADEAPVILHLSLISVCKINWAWIGLTFGLM